MILLLSIILFIIFLIYSIKPRGEGYTLEGLKLSWTNKANIEGIVTKWIITLKDSSGTVIHTYENSDVSNRKDFTDVNMNIVNNKEFDEKIIGDNTLELYYNETKDSNKLYTKTVTFTQDDFGYIIDTSKLEEIDTFKPSSYTYAKSIWFGYEDSPWNNRPLNIAEIEVYSGGVNVAKNATKTESSSQYTTNNYKPKNLIDENMSNFAHTNGSGTNWFKITLDKQYPIEKVMVYNRTSCCFARWASSFVKLLDDNGNEIVSSIEKIPDDTGLATNYKDGGVRVKTFTFPETYNTTGGFKWYYYKGSYFSGINSFSGKTPTKQGDNVTDFSSKHKATGGHLRNDGNEDNYAVKWEGFFVPKKTGSHKFWTESDDMSYLTINNVVVVDNGGLHGGMVKAPKNELNPPESSRKYSTVYSNQAPGVGHARSMLDSDQAWSAAHNVVDQWMEIDMGAKNFIAGVVVQGRKGSTQRVTSFDVSIDGKTITSTLNYTSSKDTRQTYIFRNPVIGRKVRFRVKGWNSHASMRAGVIPAKSVNLKAGQKYPIKIYFSEKGGGDELKVWFQGPGMSSAIHDFSGYMLKQ